MRFGLLGPLAVVDGQGEELVLHGPKMRALLAILLLNGNQDVAGDRLIELLWGEQARRSAAKSLQVYVSRLRPALRRDREPGRRLVTTQQGYRLRVAPGELDVERFERLVAEAEELLGEERWEAAGDKLARALELWRGDPLSDFGYESFAQSEIARLSELHVGALERRVAVELSVGHETAVICELERLVREHPYHERLHGQPMLALYRAGRQADALAAVREARARLAEELGIEPSGELARLNTAILARLRSDGGNVITLTGISGIGKTRLATAVAAVAAGMLDGFREGCSWCAWPASPSRGRSCR
ncbi:MAG: AfsR/SARP family transcriptional regulator [Solirubrobacteraceae bacterium]